MAENGPRDWDATHRFAFFEVVEVHDNPSFLDKEGVVLGKSPVEGSTEDRWYAVSAASGVTYMVEERQMNRTGRRVPRESVYDGSRARVSERGELLGIDPASGSEA